MSYGGQALNIFDMSQRGQLCLLQNDKLSACTANLLDQNFDFEAIDSSVISQSTSPVSDIIAVGVLGGDQNEEEDFFERA